MEPGTRYDDTSELRRPPAGAIGLSAVRGLPGGAMRQYTSIEFSRGWAGVERFIRILRAVGYIEPCTPKDSYAVLDVIDADGDILDSYDLPHARAFKYVYRTLQLRIEEGSP